MSRAKKWGRAALILACVAFLGSIIWILALMGERDSRLPKLALTLPQERQRARAAGLPQTMAELPPRAPLTEKDNAAPLYREAVNLLPEWSADERGSVQRALDLNAKALPGDSERVKRLSDGALPALKRAIEGARRPHCNFGWDGDLTEDEWKQRREVLVGCDRLARLFLVWARGSHDPDEILLCLWLCERLTRHLTEEPGLLVWQSRSALASLAAQHLHALALDYPQLTLQIQAALESWVPPPGLLKRVWWIQCIKEQHDAQLNRQKPYKPENEPFLDYNPLWRELDRMDHLLGWKLYADASEVINLRYWRGVKATLQPIADTDLRAQWHALKALDTAEEVRAKAFNGYWYPQRYSGIAAQLLVAQLNQQLLPLLQELRRVQARTGGYPKKLEDLPKAVNILDPFSGKPLHWKAPVLYSIGPDEKDDGGDPKKDIVFDVDSTKKTPLARMQRGALRRPGRTTGQVE